MIKVYTEDDHLSKDDDNMKELYGDLKSAILSLGKDIELRPKKFYIAFRVSFRDIFRFYFSFLCCD